MVTVILTGGPLGTLPQMEKARAAAGRAVQRRAACLAPAVLMVVDSIVAGCGGRGVRLEKKEKRDSGERYLEWNEEEGGFGGAFWGRPVARAVE